MSSETQDKSDKKWFRRGKISEEEIEWGKMRHLENDVKWGDNIRQNKIRIDDLDNRVEICKS